MMDPSGQTESRSLRHYLLAGLLIAAWVVLYHDALLSAIRIWYISEIFSHGFFILPGALYLIWRERERLQRLTPKPNYWVLTLLLPFLLLGIAGVVGDIQVFSHISAFTVLSLMIWLCFGNAIAKEIWFPLCFILFSIPIGEELVPVLQVITADLAIAILKWTSIPVYNTGLYIEIPQGKFVVAEACSGIRFFVGSLVFGAIYSHLTYNSFKRKVAFMTLATIVPIIANAIRVFGIVMIGYYSDMEYAVGADHLIYGWVFFGIVLLLLVLIGETFKEKLPVANSDEKQSLRSVLNSIKLSAKAMNALRAPLTVVLVLFGLTIIWQNTVVPDGDYLPDKIDRTQLSAFATPVRPDSAWQLVSSGEHDLFFGREEDIELAIAWFAENRSGSELISSANRFYDVDRWSALGSDKISVDFGGVENVVKVVRITSSAGKKYLLLYWYQLSDQVFVSRVKTKLMQTVDVLAGGNGAGALIVFAVPFRDSEYQSTLERLVRSASRYHSSIVEAIPF